MSSPLSSSASDETAPLEQLTAILSVKETSALPRTPPRRHPQVERLMAGERQSVTGQCDQTPPSFKSSSRKTIAHTKDVLDEPLVNEVDMLTMLASHDDWVDAVCGVSPTVLRQWTAYIKEQNYFNDEAISDSLKNFCGAAWEPSRYRPLSALINRILCLVQGGGPDGKKMPGLPDSPPIHDITFFRNDPTYLIAPPEQGALAAQRKPDIIATRRSEVTQTKKQAAVKWSRLLLYVELKFKAKLTAKLQARRQDGEDLLTYVYNDPEVIVDVTPSDPESSTVLESDQAPVEADTRPKGQKRGRDDDEESPQPRKKTNSALNPASGVPVPIKSERAQMAAYGLELAGSTRGTRLHNLGVFFRDDLLDLWMLDASGPVRTNTMVSIIDDFEKAMAILVAVAFCSPEQLGAYPRDIIRPPSPGYPTSFPPDSLSGYTIDMTEPNSSSAVTEAPCIVTFGNHIFTQYVLFGRRTTVYKASLAGDDRLYAIKVSQQYISRKSEVKLVAHARKCGVEHLPDILKSRDAWSLSNGIRKHAAFCGPPDNRFDDRVLRCILLPYYTPLSEHLAKHPDSIKVMVHQMLQCIHDLRYKAHILHRDISDGNIMHTIKNGQDWFILNDFDLAIRVNESGQPEGSSARHRTGTLPFMASELLRDMHAAEMKKIDKNATPEYSVPHCVRFDYQSLLWVSLWCAVRILPKGTSAAEVTLRDKCLLNWEKGTFKALANEKHALLSKTTELLLLPFSPLFKHLENWLLAFQRPFIYASFKEALLRPENVTNMDFEEFEEGNGEITLKKFQKSFRAYDREQCTAAKAA